jgi:hypothetical protein
MIPYADLSTVAGRDVQHKRRDLLDTARRLAFREHRKVFRAVTNVGLKCLTSPDFLAVGEQHRGRLHRGCRKTVQELTCAVLSELTPDERYTLMAHQSILGAVTVLTEPRVLQRARTVTQQLQMPMDVRHYQNLFG